MYMARSGRYMATPRHRRSRWERPSTPARATKVPLGDPQSVAAPRRRFQETTDDQILYMCVCF